jgi:uncharacterized protein YbjT (DUF2867 family)
VQLSPVLVIGASGFVGRHLCATLNAAGFTVRRATSRAGRHEVPNDAWVYLDLAEPRSYTHALEGCGSVVYLYHGLGTDKAYPEREAEAAIGIREAATHAGTKRLVYLGGVIPAEGCSQHLQSRRMTGEILRSGSPSTIELRAAMIIGCGSASFNLVRDLVVRVPVLALPPWLDNASFPISIDDVCFALTLALTLPLTESVWFELPGPERVTHRELVQRLGELLGTRVFEAPFGLLTPSVSSRLLALIGRERHSLVSELVSGLRADLTPYGPSFWEYVKKRPERSLRDAILSAIADESSSIQPSPGTEDRLRIRGQSLRGLVQ